MGLQNKYTKKMITVLAIVLLLALSVSITFAQTVLLGVAVDGVDADMQTVTLVNQDAVPADLTDYMLIMFNFDETTGAFLGSENVMLPDDSMIGANGELTVDYSGSGIDFTVGTGDNIQLVFLDDSGQPIIVDTFVVPEAPTAVTLNNVAVDGSTSVALVALAAMVIVSVGVIHTSKEN